MTTVLLNISDIHVGSNHAENEGAVLNAFIKDVEEQVSHMEFDNIFVVISGDLVFAATSNSYQLFYEKVVSKLMRVLSIDESYFIITPGNHDLNRNLIDDIKESFFPIVDKHYAEEDFNNLIRKKAQESLFFSKFEAYESFMKETMKRPDNSLLVNRYAINEHWGIYTLNSAILSCGGFNGKDDNGVLGVDTRGLHEYLENNPNERKILVMHHPEYFCMDWVKHELRKLYHSDFDIVLSGHTHDQDYVKNNTKDGYVRCEAPQLFTDKADEVLGYNFIELVDENITRIIYREWLEKRNKFRAGSAFTDDESGMEIILQPSKGIDNQSELQDVMDPETSYIEMELSHRLKEEMESFVGQPYIWIDRYLSDDRIDQRFSLHKSKLFSETDIIEENKSIRIVAPSQYGMTCYGSHFLLTLWKTQKKFGIKVDANNVKAKKFESLVKRELERYRRNEADVEWLIIDNWHPYKKDRAAIRNYLNLNFPEVRIMLLCPYHEIHFGNHVCDEGLNIDKTLYLTPLNRGQERLIVDEYNKLKFIDESDAVLSKLDDDIKNFNLHRTPYNCITLLTVFKDSFDRNPVNRTAVLENVLNIIFDNTRLPSYKTSNPDVKDCEFCLGYFCAQMLEKEDYFFTQDSFFSVVKEFCKSKQIKIDITLLFEILCYNRIIIEDSECYTFHFTFWVYYFAASWMHVDSNYAARMLADHRYQHYPEVLEFYTGKDRKRINAIKTITNDLSIASKSVQKKAGLPNDLGNPFALLRYNNSKERNEKVLKEIEENVQRSNLPQEIKDQAADVTFNPNVAFHQEIFKVYSDFSMGYLVNLITIASKALRNSDYLDADVKHSLLKEVTYSLKVFAHVMFLVSPLFAKQGYIQLPEYGFKLTEDFDKYDEKEKITQIIATIPYNLIMMFKEDLFSSKLSPVFISQFKEETDKVRKHLLAAFIIMKQPEGWEEAIRIYLNQVSQESYYLGSTLELMQFVYYSDTVSNTDTLKMKNLIKSAMYKAENGVLPPSSTLAARLQIPSKDKSEE